MFHSQLHNAGGPPGRASRLLYHKPPAAMGSEAYGDPDPIAYAPWASVPCHTQASCGIMEAEYGYSKGG